MRFNDIRNKIILGSLGFLGLCIIASPFIPKSHDMPAKTASDPAYEKFDWSQARTMCGFLMKEKLRDPDSLKIDDVVINESKGHLGVAAIKYRAKNGFGGMNRDTAICVKYEDAAGTVRLKIDL